MNVPRLIIAGTHSGVGKTTVATGLMAAFSERGEKVAPFKVGPDFIDPSYHSLAAGRPGRNLDAFLSGEGLVAPLFLHGSEGASLAVVEGVMGLYDGRSGGGDFASTAHVAKILAAPVVLVVDASAMARSAAAMVHGYAAFDPDVRMAGVVLNRVGSEAHEHMLREAIRPLGVPVVGVMRRSEEISTPDRHLGLIPAAERRGAAAAMVNRLGDAVARSCDLEAIKNIARSAEPIAADAWNPKPKTPVWAGLKPAPAPESVHEGDPSNHPSPRSGGESGDRNPPTTPGAALVAVAVGPAFSFLYEENIELLRGAGADIAFFDPTADDKLPEGADALYLGGGFPEAYAEALAENEPMKREVRCFADSGRPVAAECGGLLYLCRDLDGMPMCAVIEASARMSKRLTLGYREATATSDSPLAEAGATLRGHEFHYSTVEPGSGGDEKAAWEFVGVGAEGFVAGDLGNVHASYLHTHWAATPEVPRRLVEFAVKRREPGRFAPGSRGSGGGSREMPGVEPSAGKASRRVYGESIGRGGEDAAVSADGDLSRTPRGGAGVGGILDSTSPDAFAHPSDEPSAESERRLDGESVASAHPPAPDSRSERSERLPTPGERSRRRSKLVGVGVGPGDPELLTLKGLRAFEEADVVFVPVGDTGEVGRAEAVVRAHGIGGGKVRRLVFALSADEAEMARNHREAARIVAESLRGGSECAFATIGDPNVYSTFTYLARRVREEAPDAEIRTIPGITAMQALASRSGKPLVEGSERLVLLPFIGGAERFREAFALGETVVCYKGGGRMPEMAKLAEEAGRLDGAVYGARLGSGEERVGGIEDVDGTLPYLSTVIFDGKARESDA